MTFQSTNNLYGFPQPLSKVFPAPIIAQRAPQTTDYKFPIGQLWVDEAGNDYYGLVDVTGNSATWNVLAANPGNVDTLTGDTGGAITPAGGDIGLRGTANQITTTGSGNHITWSLPAAITAPGSLTATTTLAAGTTVTAGTGLVATTGGLTVSAGGAAITGTTTINSSGASATTIGTGGTGTVSIGNATGNTAVTGSLTASTTLTATLGAITATNGNLVLTAAGNKMIRSSVGTTTTAGANSIGSVTLVGGTATVSTTAVTTNSLIQLWRQGIGSTGAAALGQISVGTITNGTSFVINAWQAADATALQASDVSVIGWEIIN